MFSQRGVITIIGLILITWMAFKVPKPTENIWRSGGKHWINHMEEYKTEYEQKMKTDPKIAAGPLNGLANAYMDEGKIDLAIETYTKSIELDPGFPSPYNGRALAYQAKGLYAKSLDDLNKALELNPNYAFAYVNRGLNYFALEQYDEAIKDLTKAIQINPHYADSYFNRALVYERKEDLESALQDYTKAIELAPYEVHAMDAYKARAAIYKELGNDKEAIADLDRANLLMLNLKIPH